MNILEFSQNPYEYLVFYLESHYKCGKVGLVGGGDELAKMLVRRGASVELFDYDYEGLPPENIRYFVGVGGWEEINLAKRLAGFNNSIIIPKGNYRRSFSDICTNGYQKIRILPPKLVIVDRNNLEKDWHYILVDLLSLLFDTIDIALGKGGGNQLFVDMKELLVNAFFSLSSPQKGIEIIKRATSAFELSGFIGMSDIISTVNRINFTQLSSTDFDFFTFYLINLALLQFTKVKLNGIVIGADRVKARRLLKCRGEEPRSIPFTWWDCEGGESFSGKDLPLTSNNLEGIALRYRQLRKGLSYPSETLTKSYENLQIAYELAHSDGLLTKLIANGFLKQNYTKKGIKTDETKN